MTTTSWHRMTRADWYRTKTDSHDAIDCPYDGAPGTLGGCPAEDVALDNPRYDLRESWMAREQERKTLTQDDRRDRLAGLAAQVASLQSQIASEVDDARLANVPWSTIAAGLGITRQAAQQRYGRG